MTQYCYRTKGTCSQLIQIVLEDDGHTIHSVEFFGGCPGNLQGISRLVKGQDAREIVERLGGVRCGEKSTSCPDQLSRALTEAMAQTASM